MLKKFLAIISLAMFITTPVEASLMIKKDPEKVVIKPNKYRPHETPKPPKIKPGTRSNPPSNFKPASPGRKNPPPKPNPPNPDHRVRW